MKSKSLCIVLLAILTAIAGCSTETANFDLALGHSLQKIRNDGVGLEKLSQTDSVRLEAAKDETESFQIVVIAGEQALKNVKVSAPALKGPGGQIKLRWHRVEYTKTQKPKYETEYVGWWPDPLFPAGKFNVEADRVQPLWFAVDVPAETKAGTYEGKVVFKAGGNRKEIKVSVRVRDFRLPRPGTFAAPFGLYAPMLSEWYYGKGDYSKKMPIEKFSQWCEFIAGYRLTPKNIGYEYVDRNIKGEKINSEGANTGRKMAEEGIDPEGIIVNMDKLHQTVGKFNDKYFPPYSYGVYRLPTFESFGEKVDGKFVRDKSKEDPVKTAYPVNAHIDEWKRQGLPEEVYIYGIDEPRDFHTQLLKGTHSEIKKSMPSAKIMQTFSAGKPDQLVGLVDIWCPITPVLGNFAEFYHERLAAGDMLWMYVCCWPTKPFANFFIDEPATNHRVLFWQARKYKTTGLLYWSVAWWKGFDTPHTAEKAFPEVPFDYSKSTVYKEGQFNGDGLHVYPGSDMTPWPSITLEIIHDGIEDYEYIALLDKLVIEAEGKDDLSDSDKGLIEKAKQLVEVPDAIYKTMTEYTDDPQVIFDRRTQIADAIEELGDLLAKNTEEKLLTVIADGVSDYKIVVPDESSPVINYAAKELRYFLAKITGVELPIVSESETGNSPALFIGTNSRTDETVLEELSKLAEDGVLVKTSGRDVILLGSNERGQLYSVYILLEKFLGVRFLTLDCTVIPKKAAVSLPEMDYVYAPPFMYRETLYFDSYPKQIATRQRLNGPLTECDAEVGGRWIIHPYCHSFDKLVPAEEYFQEHPEYYSLIKGERKSESIHAQLCLTNPDVLKIATEKVLQWCEEYPHVPIIDVSQNDGHGWCECEKCMAIAAEEGSQHGPILRFVNAIADAVAEKYPDKWIKTLAYAYAVDPPQITRPRDNVIIRLCHTGDYFAGFERNDLGSNLASNLERWRKQTRRILIWHYATNFHHYLAPNQNLNGLARDIKAYARRGANGVIIQGNYQSPGGELAELRQYLAAQLMWDPQQDPMTIREDFCRGYYGAASEEVLAYLSVMDKLSDDPNNSAKWVAFGAWDPQTTVPAEFITEGLEILTQAHEKADTPEISNRIDKLLLPLWYMQLTYPDKYGLEVNDAGAILDRFEAIVRANKITHHIESGASDQDPGGVQDIWYIRKVFLRNANIYHWLNQMQEKYSDAQDKEIGIKVEPANK